MEEVLDRVDKAIVGRDRLQIGVVNAAKLVNMRRDPALRADVLSCNLILADGVSVVWASRLLGRRLPERVAGIDLMLGMLRRGNENGYRVYCLGASEDVLATAVARITADYPPPGWSAAITATSPHRRSPGLSRPSPTRSRTSCSGNELAKKERFLARRRDQLGVAGVPWRRGVVRRSRRARFAELL